jgi:hypothetical protein
MNETAALLARPNGAVPPSCQVDWPPTKAAGPRGERMVTASSSGASATNLVAGIGRPLLYDIGAPELVVCFTRLRDAWSGPVARASAMITKVLSWRRIRLL